MSGETAEGSSKARGVTENNSAQRADSQRKTEPPTSSPPSTDGRPEDGLPDGGSRARLAEAVALSEGRGPTAAEREAAHKIRGRLEVRPTGSKLRGGLDWILFVAFILPGFVGIILLKQYGVAAEVVAGLAAALMVAYALIAYWLPRVRIRPDRLGDNMYYMGFVFTLASMSAALIDMQRGADVASLIGSFGIALFSTIVGIAGRVVLLQMRTEVEDVEEIVRQDLIDQAGKLRGQMTAAVNDLEVFRLGVRHSLEEKLTEAFTTHQTALQAQIGMLDTTTKSVTERIRASFEANESASSAVRNAAQETAEALRGLTRRFGQINPPSDLIDRKLERTMTRIEEVVRTFEETAGSETERHRSLHAATTSLEAIVAGLQRDLLRLEEAASGVGRVSVPTAELSKALAALSAQAEMTRDTLEAQRAVVGLAEAKHKDLVVSLDTARSSLTELTLAMSGAAQTTAGGGAELATSMRQLTTTIATSRGDLADWASGVSDIRQRVDIDVVAMIDAMASVRRSLAETAAIAATAAHPTSTSAAVAPASPEATRGAAAVEQTGTPYAAVTAATPTMAPTSVPAGAAQLGATRTPPEATDIASNGAPLQGR